MAGVMAMTSPEEDAVEAAVDAYHAVEAHQERSGPYEGLAPSEVLERRLGPLSWSFDGDGFRLLRAVLERAAGPPPRPSPRRRVRLAFYDSYRRGRERLSRTWTGRT
jgi:hypothetical protein